MKTVLRIALLTLICLATAPHPASAQSGNSSEPELVRGGTRALAFTLDQLSLDGLDGGIAGRFFIGPQTALRVGMNLNIDSTEEIAEGDNDFGRSAFGIGTSFLAEWHSTLYKRVSPYMGAGFGVGFNAFSTTRDFGAGALTQERFKGTELDLDVDVALGVEVFLSRSVSLAGEHLIGADIVISDTERREVFRDRSPDVISTQEGRAFTFGTGTSRIILSVYF